MADNSTGNYGDIITMADNSRGNYSDAISMDVFVSVSVPFRHAIVDNLTGT